jgi:hypothetical protein
VQGLFLDVFALYGFNPWRTVLWSVAFVLLFAGVWGFAARGCQRADCKDESVFVMALKGNFGQDDRQAADNYPPFHPLAYSLDVFLPFVDLGYQSHWLPHMVEPPALAVEVPAVAPLGWPATKLSLTWGALLYGLYVLEMLLGLVLTSLAVTAFTGLLRGEDENR